MKTADNRFVVKMVILTIALVAWQPMVLFWAEEHAAADATGMYFGKKRAWDAGLPPCN